jgi:hypothetical protein
MCGPDKYKNSLYYILNIFIFQWFSFVVSWYNQSETAVRLALPVRTVPEEGEGYGKCRVQDPPGFPQAGQRAAGGISRDTGGEH